MTQDASPGELRVVAIGGGHGLAATLRAVRRYATDITAVVSAADDGGSSGRLREGLSISPPGDLRRCLNALADPSSALGAALEYRFPSGDMAGHALGNLLIAGLADAAGGFVAALDEVGRLVGAAGRVLPATTGPVTLVANPASVGRVEGQVAVQNTAGIKRLAVHPDQPVTPPEVVAAIGLADQVVIGPGSLFTSVLAATIVPAVLSALQTCRAPKVYVCNLAPEDPETAGFTAVDHVNALLSHGVPIDVMLCHAGPLGCTGAGNGAAPSVRCIERSVADAAGLVHDPAGLAAALCDLL